MNIRHGEKFGILDQDKMLSQNLVKGTMVQPIRAKPEGEGFGVYIGRRRFFAKKRARAKFLIVGDEVLIKDLSDEEALDDSLRENLDTFRSKLNPIVRAKALKKLMKTKNMSIRDIANVWRIPPANIGDWIQVLKLSPRMQESVAKGNIFFTDALMLVRMNLLDEQQKELAELSDNSLQDFKAELKRLLSHREKRGIPEGKYEIWRITFDKGNSADHERYEKYMQLCKISKLDPNEVAKKLMDAFIKGDVVLSE